MKKHIIILSMIIPIILSAGQFMDNTLKEQCKYVLHGNLQGTNSEQADGYLLGFIQGIEYMTSKADLTEFFTSRNYRMIKEKACENALKNSTSKGFEADYKLQAYKLISTK